MRYSFLMMLASVAAAMWWQLTPIQMMGMLIALWLLFWFWNAKYEQIMATPLIQQYIPYEALQVSERQQNRAREQRAQNYADKHPAEAEKRRIAIKEHVTRTQLPMYVQFWDEHTRRWEVWETTVEELEKYVNQRKKEGIKLLDGRSQFPEFHKNPQYRMYTPYYYVLFSDGFYWVASADPTDVGWSKNEWRTDFDISKLPKNLQKLHHQQHGIPFGERELVQIQNNKQQANNQQNRRDHQQRHNQQDRYNDRHTESYRDDYEQPPIEIS